MLELVRKMRRDHVSICVFGHCHSITSVWAPHARQDGNSVGPWALS